MAVLCVGRLVDGCLVVLLGDTVVLAVVVVTGALEASWAGFGDIVVVTVVDVLLAGAMLELLRVSILSKFMS